MPACAAPSRRAPTSANSACRAWRCCAPASTTQAAVGEGLKNRNNIEAAAKVGRAIAEKAKAAGIETVAFDRSGYRYHGRIKALADAAREGGLQF